MISACSLDFPSGHYDASHSKLIPYGLHDDFAHVRLALSRRPAQHCAAISLVNCDADLRDIGR